MAARVTNSNSQDQSSSANANWLAAMIEDASPIAKIPTQVLITIGEIFGNGGLNEIAHPMPTNNTVASIILCQSIRVIASHMIGMLVSGKKGEAST